MIFFGISIGIFLLDFLIKRKIEKPNRSGILLQSARDGMAAGVQGTTDRTEEDSAQEEKTILKNTVILRKYHNHGVAFDRLEKHQLLVLFLSGAMTGLVAFLLGRFGKDKSRTGYKMGLALVLGGALSNTYDRLKKGYVVDYFSFNTKWEKLRNVVFNISDFFIFIGSILTAVFHK